MSLADAQVTGATNAALLRAYESNRVTPIDRGVQIPTELLSPELAQSGSDRWQISQAALSGQSRVILISRTPKVTCYCDDCCSFSGDSCRCC